MLQLFFLLINVSSYNNIGLYYSRWFNMLHVIYE